VANALDYAHRQGVVHRDIKPENILLQEGEALLADFGIALAVKEAGGNRLTQTGLSLGTPQYMSPEQATGDRGLDARSDIYSLAAVLYEMLAGEPPVTGASAQSIIAKLMTETPTRLRVLRDTVWPELDTAVARALSKTPADRFATAGEFVRALEAKGTTGATPATPMRGRSRLALGVAALVGVVALAAAIGKRDREPERPVVLGTRSQLTSTGAVLTPAISPDGKQLAFVTRQCGATGCTFSTVVQDVGGTASHTILQGATATYTLEWSPDRRNLIYTGTIGGRTGAFLVSALGGEPRFLTGSVATFWAGGDSLLLGPAFRPDSVFYIGVAALDGVPRDSIRVVGAGQNLGAISVMPGTGWIITLIVQRPLGLWQVIDRSGKVADRVVNACSCEGIATHDAVWLRRAGDGVDEYVVRIGLDRESGRLAARQDTMTHGLFTAFSVTSDGSTMVVDEGTYDHGVWAEPLDSALAGRFPEQRRLASASSPIVGAISPDGSRLLLRRSVPGPGGTSVQRYVAMPFDGGAETPVASATLPLRAYWSDSVHVAIATRTTTGRLQFGEYDTRTGAQRNRFEAPDSTVRDFFPLANGWAWIPASSDRVVTLEGGRRREFAKPARFGGISHLVVDPARRRVLYTGWGGPGADSVGMGVLSLDDGAQSLWASKLGDAGRLALSDAHDAVFIVSETSDTWTLYGADGPGRLTKLGTIGRPLASVTVSRDLKRIVANVRDYRADAWMSKVIRP
jgi:serine/threonine-protein kinase